MAPTDEQVDDFLLSCRYGELEEVQAFVKEFGRDAVVGAKDDRGNSALHMSCGNGHIEVLKFLIEDIPASLLTQTNDNGSPPIHWAILNNHVDCVRTLVDIPEERGGGIALLKQTNRAGRPAFSEAIFAGEGKEEVAGWIEGYLWKAEGGDDEELPDVKGDETKNGDGEVVKLEEGDEVVKDEAQAVDEIIEKTDGVSLKDGQ